MGKYEKPKIPKKGNKFWTVFGIVILIILLLIAALAFYIWSKLDLIVYDNELDHSVYGSGVLDDPAATEEPVGELVDISGLEQAEAAPTIPNSEIFADSDVLNILLIGTDERTNEFNVNARSDSMILVSIDKKDNEVKLVSLERGIAVPVLEGIYEGQYDWLTHIFRYGGSELLTKTVKHCFKVDVDHYVRLNFNSVRNVVDSIGGIDVELSKPEALALYSPEYPLEAGMNHLDGKLALKFARLRSIDSDWQRVGRQRKVILAVVDRLKDSSLIELNDLADEVLPLIQTNLTMLEIAELILYAPNFLQAEFDQMTIPKEGTYKGMTVMGGRGSFAIDFEVNNQILHDFLYGDGEVAD